MCFCHMKNVAIGILNNAYSFNSRTQESGSETEAEQPFEWYVSIPKSLSTWGVLFDPIVHALSNRMSRVGVYFCLLNWTWHFPIGMNFNSWTGTGIDMDFSHFPPNECYIFSLEKDSQMLSLEEELQRLKEEMEQVRNKSNVSLRFLRCSKRGMLVAPWLC